MKRLTLALSGVLFAAACTTATTPVVDGAGSVRSLAVFCREGKNLAEAMTCKTDSQLFALVGGGSKGTLALAAPLANTWVDNDPSIPGATPLRLPGEPIALAVDALGKRAYAVIADGNPSLVAIDITEAGSKPLKIAMSVPLPFVPAALTLIYRSDALLFWRYVAIADPDHGLVWVARLDQLGAAPQWIKWSVGGSPSALQWMPNAKQLWVGHLRHGFVSVVDVEKGKLVGTPISVDNACRNGLDDDGDGLIDRGDRGCDSPSDDSEQDPEVQPLCDNQQDDDGDGLTDSDDAGCAALAHASATGVSDGCRNGLDDDGDGHTDFPADSGCADFGDTSEASDNLGCANGLDDDGDGATDAQDPQCLPGSSVEWPTIAGVALATAASTACANGLDDDGDGGTDLQDGDCWGRAGSAEIGPDRTPAMRLAATPDQRTVAVAHLGRREVLFIDAETRALLRPVRGEKAPFGRASRLDERDGVLGLAVTARPTALVGTQIGASQLMGIALSPGGLAVAQVAASSTSALGIGWVVSSTTTATTVGKPALVVAGAAVDLGAAVPTRFASLGPLQTEARPNGTSYYGVQPNAESYEHRSEQWRATFEGLLPGATRTSGRFVGTGLLHDATADFCAMGVVPGDWLILGASAACAAQPATRIRVAAVYGDTLQLDVTTAQLDTVIADEAAQLASDLADAATVVAKAVAVLPQCFGDGAVPYTVRASGWLLIGSRSGLLSARPRIDGLCAEVPANELHGGRLPEPQLRSGPDGKPLRPASCPYAKGLLDPAFAPTPVHTAIFTGLQIHPGCKTRTLAGGQAVVQVLPSLRDATWVFNVTAGYQPAVTAMGAETAGLAAGPHLGYVYALDAGAGALFAVDPTASRATIRLE